MCRLLGAVAEDDASHTFALRDAPRSLRVLSAEHPHGWGVATHDGRAWSVERNVLPAGSDPRFDAAAAHATGRMVVAHVRQKTVGPTSLANTHPFLRDGWVFAHNGTLDDLDFVKRRASKRRLAGIAGDTDSEVLFAFLLTHLDEAEGDTDRALLVATSTLARRRGVGSANFLLGDGRVLYAHRMGRALSVLVRGDEPGERRGPAVLVASEPLSEERWRELRDGTLLRVTRAPAPRLVTLRAPASPELRRPRLPRATRRKAPRTRD